MGFSHFLSSKSSLSWNIKSFLVFLFLKYKYLVQLFRFPKYKKSFFVCENMKYFSILERESSIFPEWIFLFLWIWAEKLHLQKYKKFFRGFFSWNIYNSSRGFCFPKYKTQNVPFSKIEENIRTFFIGYFYYFSSLGLKSGPGSCILYYYVQDKQ